MYWIIITNVFENQGFSIDRVQSRQQEIEKVRDLMGFSSVHKLDYPTMGLDSSSINTMIPKISALFNEIKPEVIYFIININH